MSITSEPWFPGFVTGSLALVGVLVVAVLQTWRERRKAREDTKTPSPPTTQQVWERLDKVETVLGSTVVLLGEVADQWQADHPPVLSKRHVSIVANAGYMPPEWDPQVE